MKKLIFVLFIYLTFTNLLFSQILGDGSSGNPYRSTVLESIDWDNSNPHYTGWGYDDWGNRVVYVCQNISGQRSLRISSGVTIKLGAGISAVIQGPSSIMTIDNGGILEIEPGAYVTATSASYTATIGITNNGTIRLKSDALGIASLLVKNYSGSGIAEEYIYLTGGTNESGGHRWHYISTPISGVSTSIFTNNPTTLDFAQYVETIVQSDNSTGWIAYDGYVYSTDSYNLDYRFDTYPLVVGQGYNYYCSANATRTFSGVLNNSDVPVNLTCGTGYTSQGFNLIGNPFASVLDWDIITDAFGIPDEVDNAIYFTLEDGVAAYVNKVATGGATEYGSIPPMQGFFVHVNTPTTGVILTLPVGACSVDPYQIRYKGNTENGKSSSTIPLVRLKLENQKGSDDLVVRFDEKATSAFDKTFDAYKFSKTGQAISTWTKMLNVDYSINTLPFPGTSVEIPVGIYASEAGIYKLSSNELDNLDNYYVTLKDLSTNISVDLKKGEIMEFNATAGITEGRFVLTVTNITTGISDIILPDKKFSIYSSASSVNILSLTDEFSNLSGTVNIYDLTGRVVLQKNDVEWNGKGDLKQIFFNNATKGLYIVEIKAGNKKYVEKVNIQL